MCNEVLEAKEFVMVRMTMNPAMQEAMRAPRGYTMDGYPEPATNQERWEATVKAAMVVV